jgi:hypothetical protein
MAINRSKSSNNGNRYSAYNSSKMGPKGYEVVYPDLKSQNDAEFINFKDKWNKKAPSVWANKPFITVILLESYLRAARLVAEHYLSAVGRFYNMCVVLTHYAYIRQHQGKDTAIVEEALAVVWRLLYEGLGLAGWTPPARLFLALLVAAAGNLNKNPGDPKFTVEEDGDWEDGGYPKWWGKGLKPKAPRHDTPSNQQKGAIPYMINLMVIDHLPKAKQITKLLIWSCKVSMDWSAIEKGQSRVAFMEESEIQTAAVYGALRRADQGADNAGFEELAALDAYQDVAQNGYDGPEPVLPQSCIRKVINEDSGLLEDWAKAILGNHPLLCETLETAAITHSKIEDYLHGLSAGGEMAEY